jgi:SAM-dependent methyltransferase
MVVPLSQMAYWDSVGVTKTFRHPVEFSWLDQLDHTGRILDYGCGYGRVAGLLHEHGFAAVEGVDFAPAMVEAARRNNPGIRFTVLPDPPSLPFPDGTFDAVMLFAVITCIPSEAEQRAVVNELHRVLRSGGLLYLSDLCVQSDERNRARYEQFVEKYGVYGIFETDDAAVCRHNSRELLDELLEDFSVVISRDIAVTSMNGFPTQATQMLARKA